MSLKKTLILALMLAGLALYVFQVEIPREEQKEKEDLIFSSYFRNNIESLEIKNQTGTFALNNKNSEAVRSQKVDQAERSKEAAADEPTKNWQLSDIPTATLERASLNSILTAVTELKVGVALPKEDIDKDLSVYGLKEPAAQLKVTIKTEQAPQSYQLLFGKKNEYISKRYLQLIAPDQGDQSPKVYMISESLFTAITKGKNDIRSKTPLDFLDSELKKVNLKSKGNDFELTSQEQHGDGLTMPRWKITAVNGAAANFTASDSALSEFTRVTRNVRAKDFIDGEAAKPEGFGLDKPDFSLTLEFNEQAKKLLLAASFVRIEAPTSQNKEKNQNATAEKTVYLSVKDNPSIFVLESDQIDTLAKFPESFREKKLFKFTTDKVTKVEIESSGASAMVLENKEGQWSINGQTGDAVFINQFLENLTQLEAERFLTDGEKPNFDSPSYQVELSFGDKAKGILKIGAAADLDDKKKAQSFYACSHDCAEVFVIAEEALKKIQPKEESLRPVATPTAVPVAQTDNRPAENP